MFSDIGVSLFECAEAVRPHLLVSTPVTVPAVHIAEAMSIPLVYCFTMPWTASGEYPHLFFPIRLPQVAKGEGEGEGTGSRGHQLLQTASHSLNKATWLVFDEAFADVFLRPMNRLRKRMGLASVSVLSAPHRGMHASKNSHLGKHAGRHPYRAPYYIYHFSPSVVPVPVSWGSLSRVHVTGYVHPPPALDICPEGEREARVEAQQRVLAFVDSCSHASPPVPVMYAGFGSVPDMPRLESSLLSCCTDLGVAVVLCSGWSEAGERESGDHPMVHRAQYIDHSVLFPLCLCALHHGGAGTTAACLLAGCPSLTVPHMGDQFFNAACLQSLGAGVTVPGGSPTLFAKHLRPALQGILGSDRARLAAQAAGQQLRQERGLEKTVDVIASVVDRHIGQL
ncbi:UDP-glucuronosyl/UDP-glucosyltransferase, partial [Kipferlia bialata]|eukprot:g4961.t1